MSDYVLLLIHIIFYQSLLISFMENPKLKFSDLEEKPNVIYDPNPYDEKI